MNANQNRLSCVALIPARSGSTRIAGKNIRPLAGHPLLAYTIAAAQQSEVFRDIIVSTDSEHYAAIARHYGAEVPFLRPRELAGAVSPDFAWIDFTLRKFQQAGRAFDCFSILRPTSPFRQPETIRRAWQAFVSDPNADSLRAVERCKQHPGKMWIVRNGRMLPLLPFDIDGQPWHSNQYQHLPEVFVQNASLEMAWCRVVFEQKSIAGEAVIPFFTKDHEGFDINNPEDWETALRLIEKGDAALPHVAQHPFITEKAA